MPMDVVNQLLPIMQAQQLKVIEDIGSTFTASLTQLQESINLLAANQNRMGDDPPLSHRNGDNSPDGFSHQTEDNSSDDGGHRKRSSQCPSEPPVSKRPKANDVLSTTASDKLDYILDGMRNQQDPEGETQAASDKEQKVWADILHEYANDEEIGQRFRHHWYLW